MKNRDKILEKHLKATINLGKAKTLSLKSDRIYSDGACGQTRTPDLLITNVPFRFFIAFVFWL